MIAAPELSRIPISFEVESVFDVSAPVGGLGGLILSERKLNTPYVKDYDTVEGESPAQWGVRFDVSNWGLIGAYSGGERVGGAAVAFDTEGVQMLEGRRDLAVLWDIRVSPKARGRGIGSALFRAAEGWAAARGCGQLKIETQNVNVPACSFMRGRGVCWAPSTASRTASSRTKFSCCGTSSSRRRPANNGINRTRYDMAFHS